MDKKLSVFFVVFYLIILSIGNVAAYENKSSHSDFEKTQNSEITNCSDAYGIQWQKDFGSSPWSGARYEGPQPIGDCDNDGQNELLIGGRDSNLLVMKWDAGKQTYVQTKVLHTPFYPFIQYGCGGYAIGDLTGDGKNEIAATWDVAVYHYFLGRYWMIGMNFWISRNGGGSADCYIGDFDNDGKNELIMSGGPLHANSTVPPIVVLKWNGWRLVKVASYDDPNVHGDKYVYMAGLGDVDYDGKNEIVCAYANKVVALKWDKQNQVFDSTVIFQGHNPNDSPFSCVCKDCDNDGKAEVLLGYDSPHVTIFKWNGTGYATQFDEHWPVEDPVIEGIDVGDVNDDGKNEVCAGTGVIHILQWNGSTYVEQAVLPTYGACAVVSIGDCDNDGKNEINVGNVMVSTGQDYMEWVFKYGWTNAI